MWYRSGIEENAKAGDVTNVMFNNKTIMLSKRTVKNIFWWSRKGRIVQLLMYNGQGISNLIEKYIRLHYCLEVVDWTQRTLSFPFNIRNNAFNIITCRYM